MDNIDFFCLSFDNEERKERMINIFETLGITNIKFGKGVSHDDPRIASHNIENKHTIRAWSIFYGHLDMIFEFVNNSTKEFAVFCEDDVLIRLDLYKYLHELLAIFAHLKLDVLLFGYLCENEIYKYSNFPEVKTDHIISKHFPFKILKYPNDTWGTQMYMISKSYGKQILDKYYFNYAEKTILDKNTTPFAADWTITKDGNRALVYPLIAIENGISKYNDIKQNRSHTNCFTFSYSKKLFGEFL
jgi:hypothetical protein